MEAYELTVGEDRFEVLLTPFAGFVRHKETGECYKLTQEDVQYVKYIRGNG